MKFPYTFHEQIDDEFAEAYDWYETSQTGLGTRFVNAVEDKLKQISKNPEHYSKIYNGFRQARVEDFPYTIVYEFFPRKKYIHISSIHHNSRNTKTKYRREHKD